MFKMKRPLAVTGFTFFIAGSITLSMPREYTAVLLALFALFAFIHHRTRRVYTKHLLLMLISALASVVYINVYSVLWQQHIAAIPTDTAEFVGYVSEINNDDNTWYTVMLVDEKGREDFKVTLYYHNGFSLGDKLSVTGKFKPAKNNRYMFSSYADNILGTISADEIDLADVEITTAGYAGVKVKKHIIDSMTKLYRKNILAVTSAIAYNDSHLLSDRITDSFRTAGLSHALVVSGLHVWLVIGVAIKLLQYIPINKKVKNVIAVVILVAFMYIVGLSASVTRAGIFAGIILIVRNFKKEPDAITTLALIGFLCIIENPYITRDIGAMLSYSASAGLLVTNRWCSKNQIDGHKRNFICAAMAVIFTMPVMALAGMKITVLSPLFNLLLMAVLSVICVLSVVTPLLNMIPLVSCAAIVLAKINEILINSVLAILDFIDTLFGFAMINLAHPVFITVFCAALAAYAAAYAQTEDGRKRKIFVTAVSILAFVCYNLLNWNVATVTAFDSGRECSFHISAKGKEYLVLSEDIGASDAQRQLVAVNGNKFDSVYYCLKSADGYISMGEVADEFIVADNTAEYKNEVFVLNSEISKNKKLFTITLAECDISFGHGKIVSNGNEYYFLGNDKPAAVSADEIYIFGNIPKWMDVDNIHPVNSDVTIKINLKTGRYKTVEDVFNFGW